MLTLLSHAQALKALVPIFVTLKGMSASVSMVHSRKSSSGSSVMPCGSVAVCKAPQEENAPTPMLFTLFGIETF